MFYLEILGNVGVFIRSFSRGAVGRWGVGAPVLSRHLVSWIDGLEGDGLLSRARIPSEGPGPNIQLE